MPNGLAGQLREETYEYDEEKRMPYVTSFERLAKEDGEKKGLLQALTLNLKAKFGDAGVAFAQSLPTISDVNQLKEILEAAVLTSKTLDELRAMVK